MLNFGFAGALSPGLKVGDIVSADRLLFYHDGLFSEQQWLTLLQEPVGQQVQGAFVTTSRITDKDFLAKRLPAGIRQAVVEMETAALAKVACTAGIPFMAIRAISDAADEKLGFTLDEFCDRELNVKIWRVLLTVAKKPWIIPQLVRLARHTKTAGNNLSSFVCENLQKIAPT
jgi:adenosylhomocysteine nucleosidase